CSSRWSSGVASPFDGDPPFGLVHQIEHVSARLGVHGNTLAAGDIANDLFAANRIAATRAVHQQIIVSGYLDGGGFAAEDTADHASQPARDIDIAVTVAAGRVSAQMRGFCGKHTREDTTGGKLAVAESGEQIVRL